MAQYASKRDRRRFTLQTKLHKLDMQFHADKDFQYREALVDLQYRLSSLHQGDNPQLNQAMADLRDARDYELVRLRLAEEYTVQQINSQFAVQYNAAVQDANRVVALVKQKLHDGLVAKIRQLKEDKALIDIVTSSSNANAGSSSRSTRTNTMGLEDGNHSGAETSTSFFFSGERRSRRKRDATDFSLDDDSYDSTATSTGTRKRGKHSTAGGNNNTTSAGESSANEDSKVITGNSQLNEFLYGPKDTPKRRQDKHNGLGVRKGHFICEGLSVEEVNEDLMLLRNFKKSRR